MSTGERFAAWDAILEAGGCAEPSAVAPISPVTEEGAPTVLAGPREDFPLLARPAADAASTDLKAWAAAARALLDARLEQVGAILLRGLPLTTRGEFSEFFHALGYPPMAYDGAATRTEVAPGVFVPNRSSPERPVMMHNDLAHMRNTPAHLFLFCENAPHEGAGGETTLARNRDWHEALGAETIARFAERHLERKMNCPSHAMDPESSRAWERRFATEDPREVEALCARDGEVVEWWGDGGMSTRRTVPVLRDMDGEKVWFCSPQCSYDRAPIEFAYGDGEPIEKETMDRIISTQWKIAVAVPLNNGDVVCVHNLTCQHGRLPCATDDRRVFVSLATPQPGSFRV